MRLADKVALVTGATRGIGRAIAARFADEGARVVLVGRSADAGEAAAAAIVAAGGHACFVRADVGCGEEVARAVATATERFGSLTTLVNCAAATDLTGLADRGDGRLGEVSPEILAAMLRTNLWGLYWCVTHAVPAMARAGGGAIVNISSGVATKGAAGMDAYTATKGALNALTRSMAVGYARDRIRVNAIATGLVESGPAIRTLLADPARRRALAAAIPLPYFGTPDDVAWGAVYLASDEARYVTGAVLAIDGGYLACPT